MIFIEPFYFSKQKKRLSSDTFRHPDASRATVHWYVKIANDIAVYADDQFRNLFGLV